MVTLYKVTRDFPRHETFGITAQMRRAAVSVAANIVEGSARHSEREYVQFLNIAFGSLREVGYYIELSRRLGYVPGNTADQLLLRYAETARVLAAVINSLSRGM